MDHAVVVAHLRSQVYFGGCIDLVPYTSNYAADIVRLRNLPEVRYFLNQKEESTLESQLAWSKGYGLRSNDVFWVVRSKSGDIIGCNRLYNISNNQLEKGSLIVDPNYARTQPIALETDLFLMKIAFSRFYIDKIVTTVRSENLKTRSMNQRFGFTEVGPEKIRGVTYIQCQLLREVFEPAPFETILNYWSKRNER